MAWSISVIVPGLMILFGLSFWFKRTILYRFAVALYVGVSVGYSGSIIVKTLMDTAISPIQAGDIILIIPLLLGLTFFARLTKSYSFVARWPIAIIIGTGLSLGLWGAMSGTIRNITSTMKPLGQDPSMIVTVILLVAVVFYFLFHKRFRELPGANSFAKFGRIGIMIAMGIALAQIAVSSITMTQHNVVRILQFLGLL